MILNLGSLAFNADIETPGGNPAWGTELGQGEGYKFVFEDMSDFFTGMVYMSVSDTENVTCPLGKGGNQRADYDFVIASLFDKVYVNGKRVKNGRFILLVVKKLNGDHHVGRRTIKYNPRMTYRDEYINEDCYKKMASTMGLPEDAAWFVYEIYIKHQDQLHFTAFELGQEPQTYRNNDERKNAFISKLPKDGKRSHFVTSLNEYSFQEIFYGAPGTGKSHKIKDNEQVKKAEEKKLVFRTTFHPDSDYSTFVGAYKPTMKKQYRYDGKVKAKYYEDDDLADAKKDDIIIDKVIQYDFVPQTFTNAYVAAWNNQEDDVFLIIEEINRGNCAQIFGDLFQLLDRDEDGVSEYRIKADADIRTYLENELGKDADGIKDGELCLPKNLYIWATMNTSDQSLFPIDSAFKRRWDWEYEPIKYKNTDWVIEIGSNKYSWTSFQKEVNDRIFRDTNSEDKMLGDYFVNVKHKDGIISKELLLNKILFYLWNDVCKDGDGDIFKTEDNKEVKFSELYGEEGTEKLLSMMKHLKVELLFASGEDVEDDENSKDNTKYSINGNGSYAKRSLSTELVKEYISQHPEMSATEVVNKWKSLGKFVSHFIETQDEYDKRTDQNPRVNIIPCNGENIYVSTNGWGGQGVMDSLIGAIPKDWNLNIEKI